MSARDVLRPLIVAARTSAQQRALALELSDIVTDLTQRAEAGQRQQQRPPAQRLTPRSHKAGPGRACGCMSDASSGTTSAAPSG